MKTLLKNTILSASILMMFQTSVFAQEAPADTTTDTTSDTTSDAILGESLLSDTTYADGETTVDTLSIDVDIDLQGGVFMQRGAIGDIGTLTLMELDAASVDVSKIVAVSGDTHLGEEAIISEGNIHLAGDMGTVSVSQRYSRTGTIQLSHRARINVGNVMVPR